MAQDNDWPQFVRPIKVFIKDLNSREHLPSRTINLFPAVYELKIGRGSQADAHLHPKESNAWFTSRVMSREHAILRLYPVMKKISIEDTGSMHGTYVDGTKLENGKETSIRENQRLQFGAEIIRGDQVYMPLEVSLGVDWPESVPWEVQDRHRRLQAQQNSFTVDYSEDENDADDIEVVYESFGGQRQPRTFSVPDSNASDSEIERQEHNDSAPSSQADDLEVDHTEVTAASKVPEAAYTLEDNPGQKIYKPTDVLSTAGNADQEDNDSRSAAIAEEADAASLYSDEIDDISDNNSENLVDPFLGDSDDDDEEEEEHEEEDQFDYIHQEGTGVPESRVSNNELNRPANLFRSAMPKPSWYQPPSSFPAAHNLTGQAPLQPMGFTDNFSGISPPVTHFPPFNYYHPNMNWANNDSHVPYINPYPPTTTLPNISPQISTVNRMRNAASTGQVVGIPQQDTTSRVAENVECSIKPTKVSINDIIDSAPKSSITVHTARKRKSDEISSIVADETYTKLNEDHVKNADVSFPRDKSEEATQAAVIPIKPSSGPVEVQARSETAADRESPVEKPATSSSEALAIDAITSRPNKKVKLNRGAQGSVLLKYFATAVAGAAMGAVGTVFGLAALPTDYFE